MMPEQGKAFNLTGYGIAAEGDLETVSCKGEQAGRHPE